MQVDILLFALLCGHFTGDFLLQTDAIARRKPKRVKWMLCHVGLVAILTWILLGSVKAWWIAVIILLLHLLVDYAKAMIGNKIEKTVNEVNSQSGHSDKEMDENRQAGSKRNFHLFLIDQALHVASIVALWACLSTFAMTAPLTNHWLNLWGLNYAKALLLLTGIAVGVWGVGIVLKYQMAEFATNLEFAAKQGLPKGGKTIGTLERLLIFMFVLAGKPEGVGFVLAAKTVFRIGHLTNQQEKDQAEYIMIGTLRSFTYALIVAFAIKWLIANLR